jgi:DNA replication protein DnaC
VAGPAAGRAEPERACPLGVCDGSGWIVGPEEVARPCECREERLRRARNRGVAAVIPAKYRGVSFERPPVTEMERDLQQRTVVKAVRGYIEELEANLRSGRGLWLMGDAGTGKTTLAMLVSKAALESGHSVALYSLPKLLARIRRTYDSEAGEDSYTEFFDRLTSVDLLHIDDLGAEKRSDWVIEQLYSVFNQRYEDERAIVVTTNLTQEGLEEQIGSRIVSRLSEMTELLPMYGTDRRIEYRAASG